MVLQANVRVAQLRDDLRPEQEVNFEELTYLYCSDKVAKPEFAGLTRLEFLAHRTARVNQRQVPHFRVLSHYFFEHLQRDHSLNPELAEVLL